MGPERFQHLRHAGDVAAGADAGDQRIERRVGEVGGDLLRRGADMDVDIGGRSEEHTSELQSLMRISYAVFCLKKKKKRQTQMLLTVDHKTSMITTNRIAHIHK